LTSLEASSTRSNQSTGTAHDASGTGDMTAVAPDRDNADREARAHEAILDDDPAGTRLTGFPTPRALQAAASAAPQVPGIARDS